MNPIRSGKAERNYSASRAYIFAARAEMVYPEYQYCTDDMIRIVKFKRNCDRKLCEIK